MEKACPRCNATWIAPLTVCFACLWWREDAPFELEGYAIDREIGHGGMGAVYLARQARLDRAVAIKVISGPVALRADARARFAREATLLARLNHPHIVTLYDYGEQDGTPYLVMEYIAGESLARRALPAARVIELVIEVCEALDYAHAQGIVHRDIKPSNILVDERGHARVVDFGIARLFGDDTPSDLTRTGVTIGTPHFMAPELERGAPADPRSDVYAVGVALFHVIAGRFPIGDLSLAVPGLEAIVRKALASDPAARYQTAGELAAALRRVGTKRRRGYLAALAAAALGATAIGIAVIPRDTQVAVRDAGAVAVASPADAPPIDAAPPIETPADAAVADAPAHVRAKRQPATLVVHVRPWADITIDGQPQAARAEPPAGEYATTAGRHRIELVNPSTQKRAVRNVDLAPGARHDLDVDLR